MRRALLIGAFLQALACTASAQDIERRAAEATEADVRRLLEVTGAAKMGLQVVATIGQSMRQAHPDVPDAVWAELLAEFRGDEITELVVPIYRKHLTGDDVRGLLVFYESPVGRKMLQVQPQILKDSMAAGQRWGEECARRVLKRLEERGYLRKAAVDRARTAVEQ